MYLPTHFEETRREELHRLIAEHPLGALVTRGPAGLDANHMPFELETEAYISPSWYPSKHEAHRQVPTWNYRVVHVHGRIAIRDDERFVRGVVARLTRVHEARAGNEPPWKMADSSKEFIDHLLTLIVGIEVEIVKMEGKWKLSQNKDERDRRNAAEELRRRGEEGVSAAMLATLGGG